MSITRYFDLYLNAGKTIPLVINVSQYDQGETWLFTLYSDTGVKYTPSSGSVVGIKSDGYLIENAGTVDEQGRVVISETQQMTAAVGKAIFELQIDNATHGTANFIVLVEPSPVDGGVLSESDISAYESVLSLAPTNSGETGQVLTKTANGTQWANGGGGSVTVDSSLSTSSTNPVQNKVITSALATKIDLPSGGVDDQVLAKTSSGIEWVDKAGQVYLLEHSIENGDREIKLQRYLASSEYPEQAGIIRVVENISSGNTLPVQSGAVYTALGNKADKISKTTVSGTSVTQALTENTFYVFGEVSALTVTLATPADANILNEYHFRFTSGSTATTLTLPNSVTMPSGFAVEASKTYEISIVDNYGVYVAW